MPRITRRPFKFIFLVLLLTINCLIGFAQTRDGFPLNARANGIAHTTATIRDEFAMMNNVAGISDLDGTYANFSYGNRFSNAAFQTVGASIVHPLGHGGIGLVASRFGDDIYSEQQLGLGYGHQLRAVSLGAKVNYTQVSITEFGTKGTLSFDFGGIAPMAENLWFGAYIINLNQAKLADFEDERSPTIMRAGLSYRPFTALMINAEVEKDIELPASARVGVEYVPVQKFCLRTGVSTKSFMGYFGAGFDSGRLKVDYAASTHQDLGLSHSLSVSYRLITNEAGDEAE